MPELWQRRVQEVAVPAPGVPHGVRGPWAVGGHRWKKRDARWTREARGVRGRRGGRTDHTQHAAQLTQPGRNETHAKAPVSTSASATHALRAVH